MLVELHFRLAVRQRHLYVADPGGGFERLRYGADAAAAGHSRYLQKFSLHSDLPFMVDLVGKG